MILDTNALTAMADGNPGIDVVLKQADAIEIPTVVPRGVPVRNTSVEATIAL
jgi:hypothetical protein